MICNCRRRVVGRKEAGCQWESPKEDRKEVGCQSDATLRSDVGVQVDLLTQQLSGRQSGVLWQCNNVRADEPGGGALLHFCNTHTRCHGQYINRPLLHADHSHALCLLCPTWLPTMPLFSEPLHVLPDEAGPLLQSSPCPADVSSAPPGLIAPLSPRLAEEEEEEQHQQEHLSNANKECVYIHQAVSEEEKEEEKSRRSHGSKRRMSSPADKPTNHITRKVEPSRRSRQNTSLLKEDEELQANKQKEKQPPAARIQEVERVELREDEAMAKEGEGVKSLTMKNKEVEPQRPRRRTVGPTVRYLLEYEEQSYGLRPANHNRAREDKVKRKVGRPRKEKEENRERCVDSEKRGEEQLDSNRVESSEEGGAEGWWQLCKVCGLNFTSQASLDLHMSVHRPKRMFGCHLCNKKFRRATKLLQHHLCHQQSSRDGTTLSRTRAAAGDQEEQDADVQGDEDRSSEEAEEEADKEEWKKPVLTAPTKAPNSSRRMKRLHRNPGWLADYWTMKRKRIRCRKEVKQACVEKEPHRPRRTMVGPPVRYLLESEETSRGPGTANQINQEAARKPTKRRGRPKKVAGDSEAGGGASEMFDEPKAEDKEIVHLNVNEGGEEEEHPQRMRRTMVGPPIRYLLESEELSHWPGTANQTNQQAASKPTGRRGRPQKVCSPNFTSQVSLDHHMSIHRPKQVFGCHFCNRKFRRATKLLQHHLCHQQSSRDGTTLSRTRAAAGDQEEQDADVQGDEDRSSEEEEEADKEVWKKPLLTAPAKAPNCSRRMKRLHRNPGWLVDYWTMKRKRIRCRKEVKQACVEKEPHRPRRTMVGPPVRYLLESEETSRGPGTANQINQEAARKPTKRRGRPKKVAGDSEAGGGASEMFGEPKAEDKEIVHLNANEGREEEEHPQRMRRTMVGPPIRYLLESEELSHWPGTANQEGPNKAIQRRGRPKKVAGDSEAGGGASEMFDEPKAEDKEIVHLNANEGREEEEHPQRMRRTMVGPPIRYLLESEELSHWPGTASQEGPNKAIQRRGRPKKVVGLNEAGGGASEMIDRPEAVNTGRSIERETSHMVKNGGRGEGEKRAEREEEEKKEEPHRPRKIICPPIRYLLKSEPSHGPGTTNQDKENKPKQRRGRPRKVIIHSEAGGGASKRIDRSESDANDTGHMVKEDGREEEQARKRRRTMTGPSHGPGTANQDVENKAKQRSRRSKVCGPNVTSQASLDLHMSVHRPERVFGCHFCNKKFRRATKLLQHLLCHQQSSRDGTTLSRTRAADVQDDEDRSSEEEEQPQRRMMVHPPIRYLPETEEMSHSPVTANQTNQEAANKPKQAGGRAKKVVDLNETEGGASEMIGRSESGDKEIVLMVAEEGEEEEEHQRLKKTTVRPPIKCTLHSEEPSHGLITDSQDAGTKPSHGGGRPKKAVSLSEAGGGASEMMHRQTYLTYKDLQSGQVTIISPCCIRLQRLL